MDRHVVEQILRIDSDLVKRPTHFAEAKESNRIKQRISNLKEEKSI